MTLGQACISSGLVVAATFVGRRLIFDKSFKAIDITQLISLFLTGCNLPAAIFLIYYGLYPTPNALDSYEKFVSMAGLSLLAIASITIFTGISKPLDKE